MTSVEIVADKIARGWLQISARRPDAVEKVVRKIECDGAQPEYNRAVELFRAMQGPWR